MDYSERSISRSSIGLINKSLLDIFAPFQDLVKLGLCWYGMSWNRTVDFIRLISTIYTLHLSSEVDK